MPKPRRGQGATKQRRDQARQWLRLRVAKELAAMRATQGAK